MNIAEGAGNAIDTSRGTIDTLIGWLDTNRNDLLIGLAVAAGIVLFMLVLRSAGSWLVRGDPDCTRWRGVIGRVLLKTGVMFMVATALEIVVTYTAVPLSLSRVVDILFIIAFALQGAVWARELVLGMIERRAAAAEDPSESGIANAMSVIRVLVSIALFA
ncbi:MAG TPA: hypothetical protein VMK31_02180, partial [Sphingomicrobium sp.]|nr:hypothetical protein [Sphingomicrobium sp.]